MKKAEIKKNVYIFEKDASVLCFVKGTSKFKVSSLENVFKEKHFVRVIFPKKMLFFPLGVLYFQVYVFSLRF